MNDLEKALIEKIRAVCETSIADDGLVLLDAGDVLGLVSEPSRLTAALAKANAQTEHFEREWYLRGDQIEDLQADMRRLRDQFTAGVQRYREALQGWVASCDSCDGRGVLVFSRESGKSPDRIDCAGCAPFRVLLAEPKDTQPTVNMNHWPECVPPDEVGARGSCICDGKGMATPTIAGNYSSSCMGCGRRMDSADKRCILCTDCVGAPHAELEQYRTLLQRWIGGHAPFDETVATLQGAKHD